MIRDTLDYLEMFARFPFGLRRFLHHAMTLEEAQRVVRERMEDREENFLRMVERSIYGYSRSPYLALLKRAGCELGDLRARVKQKGVEGALRNLREEGVYVTFEEFKGRKPIIRGALTAPVTPRDFDNPFLTRYFVAETGGSTGSAMRVPQDLDHYAALAPHYMLARHAYGVLDAPFVLWRGVLPDNSGISHAFQTAYFGRPPQYWFTQLAPFGTKGSLKYALATYGAVLLGRFYGANIPLPRYVPLTKAAVVADAAARLLQEKGACIVATAVSRAVRVALAAQEKGLDLTGATFLVGGEPLTSAKQRAIEESGARCYSHYTMAESGRIGYNCAASPGDADVHLSLDAFALIAYPHPLEGFDVTVPAFNLTTLLPTTPKIMFNVETDDYGIVEERRCGCELGAIGFTLHLRQIRSYRKLTSEGVTLVGSDMLHILEEVLPARFGGSPGDYQLMEQEDVSGLTRLYLIIHPRIQIADEQAVLNQIMTSLHETDVAADAARVIWLQANALQIKRMEPVWTGRGKLMPLHIERIDSRDGSA